MRNKTVKIDYNEGKIIIKTSSSSKLSMLNIRGPKGTSTPGQFRPIHPVTYNDINESLVMRAALLIKGGSTPAAIEADS